MRVAFMAIEEVGHFLFEDSFLIPCPLVIKYSGNAQSHYINSSTFKGVLF